MISIVVSNEGLHTAGLHISRSVVALRDYIGVVISMASHVATHFPVSGSLAGVPSRNLNGTVICILSSHSSRLNIRILFESYC